MKIKSINIKNFKSLVNITIKEPNPFSVFVGPNASGKSNIFEALEILDYIQDDKAYETVFDLYGEFKDLLNRNKKSDDSIDFELMGSNDSEPVIFKVAINKENKRYFPSYEMDDDLAVNTINNNHSFFSILFSNFQRLFVGNESISHQKFKSGRILDYSASNLPLVLGRLLKTGRKEELYDLLSLFIPGFKEVDVLKDKLTAKESLLIYDINYKKPFTKSLISDGTYNILSLITAVLQLDEPQFLLIEEPENGLNPKVIKELVQFFREQCEEKGHYIWLASHSQTLVSELAPKELVLVDKEKGETKIKQYQNIDLHGMKLDEAWLSNVLGGGLPW